MLSTRGFHRIGAACIAVGLMLLAACGSGDSRQSDGQESETAPEYSVPDWANPVLSDGREEPPGVKIATFDETPLRVDVYQLRSKDPEAQKTAAGYLYALNYVATNTGKTPLDLTASTFRVKPTGADKNGKNDFKNLSLEMGAVAGLSEYSEQDVAAYNQFLEQSGLNAEVLNDAGVAAYEKREQHRSSVDPAESAEIDDQVLTLEPGESMAYGEGFYYQKNSPIYLELSYDAHGLYDDVVLPEKSDVTASETTAGDTADWARPVSGSGEKIMTLEGNPFNVDVYLSDVVKAPADSSDSGGGSPLVREGDDVMLVNLVVTNTGDDTELSSLRPTMNARYPGLKNHSTGSWKSADDVLDLLDEHGLYLTPNKDGHEGPYRFAHGESYAYGNMLRYVEGKKLALSVTFESLGITKKVETLDLDKEAKKLQEQESESH